MLKCQQFLNVYEHDKFRSQLSGAQKSFWPIFSAIVSLVGFVLIVILSGKMICAFFHLSFGIAGPEVRNLFHALLN